MTKRLITYTRKKINDNCWNDPNTNNRVALETNGKTIFTETPYLLEDGRFIAYVEYGDDETEENIEYFRNLDLDFNFTFIEEVEVNELLKEFGFDEDGVQYISVSDFVFSDNRPIEEF